jgi:hypothetical protein
MLENGADVRFIQELLGHTKLNVTALYAHVSIRKLQGVHERTHPAAGLPVGTTASADTTAATPPSTSASTETLVTDAEDDDPRQQLILEGLVAETEDDPEV